MTLKMWGAFSEYIDEDVQGAHISVKNCQVDTYTKDGHTERSLSSTELVEFQVSTGTLLRAYMYYPVHCSIMYN